jgi:hypothetical protein
VKNASDSKTFRNLDEHRRVFYIDDLPGRYLGDIESKTEDVLVGLADVYEARGDV